MILLINIIHKKNKKLSKGINRIKINKKFKSIYCLPCKLNKIVYNRLGVKNYSSSTSKRYSFDLWFITGLIEGSFVITITKNPRYKIGWSVQTRMQIKMHEIDRPLIILIQNFFGGIGYVYKPNKYSTVEFIVSTLKDIVNIIIPPYFDKYPLNTKKYYDYMLFKQVTFLMLDKVHNSLEGIQKIINIKASLSLGLSKELK